MRLLLVVSAALAGVLLFLLATASANVALFAQHYPLLLGLNAVLAAALAALVAWQLVSLARKVRARVFGSRLTLRFLLLFALMAVVPGALVYTVSVQFLVRSIETWFDVKVDAALEGGMSLGQAAIDQVLGELQLKGRAMALELAERAPTQLPLQLNRLREQAGVQEAVVVAGSGRLLASASAEVSQFVPELPSAMVLRQARSGRGYATVDVPAGKPLALAAILASRLAEPLAILAGATQAVARGDFSRQAPVTSRDELGVLTESFNSMTRQLDDARRVVEANRAALETAKAHLENILANLSAGVLVFDRELRVSISNHGAHTILGTELERFAASMKGQFLEHGARAWQTEFELKGTGKTVIARGAALPASGGGGHVLVFDDITQLIEAQRAMAWAEVARRLAHEIKNPLTPIQLSAERLEMKLEGKLAPEDAEALHRSTRTIVNQVTALKAMADDFRDYARLPAPRPTQLDLNALVREVLTLYEESKVQISARLAPALPAVAADSIQIRQVIHNLVQNAQDALENRKQPGAEPAIEVRTERAGDRVLLAISDNGGGFPEELMARIFEPYVTTKPRGTGLGLAIVKKIVAEHHGSVTIDNRPAQGASVTVALPLADGGGMAARAA